jgi:hypothetical protein
MDWAFGFFLSALPDQVEKARLMAIFPPETVCKRNWEIAAENQRKIEDLRNLWTGCGTCNGAIGRNLAPYIEVAERETAFWFSAWWVTWPPASLEERHKHFNRCRELLGNDAFFAGLWAWEGRP